MKLEHAERHGGRRNGGRAGPRDLISLLVFVFLIPDLGYLRYGPLGRNETYESLKKSSAGWQEYPSDLKS